MKTVGPLRTSSNTVILVQTDGDDVDLGGLSVASSFRAMSDLPDGAEPVTAIADVIDAMQSLRDGLRDIVEHVKVAIEASQPSKWKLEVNIGFKGKSAPIPFVLAGEADASIKLQFEWDRPVPSTR
jgi:hypothetical protein